MKDPLSPVDTPWGFLRPGDTVIVGTSQKKPSKGWNLFHQIHPKDFTPPLQHLGSFLGVLGKGLGRTEHNTKYPELDSYIEIETIPGVRTQIPFANIDFIR